MNRCSLALAALLAVLAPASAHFVYLVPENGAQAAKAVFSDTLKPDEKVRVEKIENTKLIVLDAAGKESAPKWELDKAGSFYKIEIPGTGTRTLAGVTDYGVLQRGEGKPFLLRYFSKTIVGELPARPTPVLGERAAVEIVPVVEGGKIRFEATAKGKPIAKAEMTVMAPGEEKSQQVVADEKGFTPWFDKAGFYGVNVRQVEAKSGEEKGKKYEEVRSYATLVVELAPAK